MIKALSTYLSSLTKDELSFILSFFGQTVPKSVKKAELLAMTAGYIGGNPVDWLMQLPERDLRLLRKINIYGADRWVELDMPEYPCILAALHLLVEDDGEEGKFMVSAPQEVLFVISPFINDVIEDKERMRLFRTERIALGILNIYGVISLPDFVDVILSMFSEEGAENIISEIARCSIIAMQKIFYNDEVYLISPYVFDHVQILEGRKEFKKKIRKYATITIEEALAAATEVPYCSYGMGGDDHTAVRSALEHIGYSESEITPIMTDIWMNSQFSMEQVCAESMFRCVNDKIDDIPSFGEYRRCIDTIASYANNTPKWLLKGRKPNDVNLLKLSIKVDENGIEEAEAEWDEAMPESIDIPGDLDEFYKFNMAIPHVQPDQPCPCGSGLSYRNCHGKKLS